MSKISSNSSTKNKSSEDYEAFDFNLLEKGIYRKSIEDKILALKHVNDFLQNSAMNNYSYGRLQGLIDSDVELSIQNPLQFLMKISTRIGNDIGSLIMSIEEYSIQIETLLILILNKKSILIGIFGASIYGNSDHFILALIDQIQSTKTQTKTVQEKRIFLLKLGILYNLNSTIPIEKIYYYFINNKHTISNFLLGLLSDNFVYSKTGQRNRDWLLNNLPKALDEFDQSWENEPERVLQLNPIGGAYMFCSYSSLPNKHKIKESIHKLIRRKNISEPLRKYEENLLTKAKGPITDRDISEKIKPTLFIVHEKMTKSHAMYRCFGPGINELKKNYNTIGITFQTNNIDDVTHKIFNTHYIADGKGITDRTAKLVALLKKYNPVAIFYPSIGMDPCCIVASSYRLAEKQIYGLGHPGPAMSKVLDGVVGFEESIEDCDPFAKNIPQPVMPMKVLFDEVKTKETWVLSKNRKQETKKDKAVIAITATSFKLTYEFFSLLKRLEKSQKDKFLIKFFVGTSRQIIDTQIHNYLNNEFSDIATFHNFLMYPDYMKLLSECDLFLSPFPFGSTNSLLDCVRVGLVGPCIASNKSYVEYAEKLLYERIGFTNFIASNEDEYLSIANELIDCYHHQNSTKIRELSESYSPKESLSALTNETYKGKSYSNAIKNFFDKESK